VFGVESSIANGNVVTVLRRFPNVGFPENINGQPLRRGREPGARFRPRLLRAEEVIQ
jgi:hypothetical protein